MIKKFIIKPLLSFVAIILIFFLMFFISNQIEFAKKEATLYLAAWIQANTGWQTEFGEIKLYFPLQVHVDEIVISNGKTPVAKIDQLTLSLSLLDLLQKQAVLKSIQMQALSISEEILKIKSATHSSNSKIILDDHAQNGLLKEFKVNHFQIDNLSLDENIIALLSNQSPYIDMQAILQSPLALSGNLAINLSEKSGLADILIAPALHPQKALHLITTITNQDEQLNFQTRLNLSQSNRILSPIFKDFLSQNFTIQSFVEAKASLKSWEKIIKGDPLLADEELKGSFQLIYSSNDSSFEKTLLGSYSSIKGNFISSAKQKLTISDLACQIGSNTLEGYLSLNHDYFFNAANFRLNVYDLSVLESKFPHLKSYGNFKIEGILSGALNRPKIDLTFSTSLLQINEERFENISAKLELQYKKTFIGLIELQSSFQQNQLNFSSRLDWDGHQELSLSDFQLKAHQVEVQGSLQIALPDKIIAGDLNGKTDLALFRNVLPQESAGTLSFKAHLRENQQKTNSSIDFLLTAEELQVGPIRLKAAALTAQGALSNSPMVLKLECQKISKDQWSTANVLAETTIDLKEPQWPFALSTSHEKEDYLQLQSQGQWHWAADAFSITFNTLQGSLADHQWTLQKSFSLQSNQKNLELTAADFTLDNGTLRTALKQSLHDSQVKFEAENLPLNLLYLLNPEFPLLTGNFSGAASFSETPLSTSGEISLEVHNFKFLVEPIETPEYMHAVFNAQLLANTLHCQGEIKGLSPRPIEISANLPVTIALSAPQFEIDRNKAFDGNLELHGPIGPLLELFISGNATNINGQAHLFLEAAGTLAAPQINGRAEIAEGYFELLGLGTSLKNAQATLLIQGSKATITEFTATDGMSGQITASGTAEFDLQKKFPFSLLIDVNKAALLKMDYILGTASGQLAFEGNSEKALLKGKLVTDSLVINMPDQVSDLAEALEVTYINQPENSVKPTQYTIAKSTWPLAFDLDIKMPGKGFIKGTNLTSEWKGSLLMTGSSDLPLFNGSCQIIQGQYNIQGKPFQIKQGSITFAGDIEKKTTFYVIASKDIEQIKADIIVKGNLKNPAISFQSNPPLPQREILSWILFNRGSSGINAFQGTQLNESITNLPTESGEPDLLTKIRNRIGIDRIDINRNDSSGASNEVSVQVGKYLSKGIFVSINKSVTAEANRLAIEANLIKNFKVQAEVGDDADAQLQLKWKHDY